MKSERTTAKTNAPAAEAEREASANAELAHVTRLNERERPAALAALAPRLPETLVREALCMVEKMVDSQERIDAFIELAPYLPETLLRDASSVVMRDDQNDGAYAYVISRLPKHIGIIINGAPIPESKALVENDANPPYNQLVIDRLKTGDADFKQRLSETMRELASLIKERGNDAVNKEIAGAASLGDRALGEAGMVVADCFKAATETTRPAPPPKMSMTPQQVAALTADTPLGRLQVRYEKRLREIVLPKDEIKDVNQARAAALLVATFRNLVKQQIEAGLEPQPQDPRVTKAQSLSVAFYRKKRAKRAPPRPGRPSKAATASLG